MDPAFRLIRFPLEWRARFFILEYDFYSLKTDLELPLIFILFFKGKQNKKEILSATPDFWKRRVCEKPDRALGSGYLSERYGMDRSTPLSP